MFIYLKKKKKSFQGKKKNKLRKNIKLACGLAYLDQVYVKLQTFTYLGGPHREILNTDFKNRT